MKIFTYILALAACFVATTGIASADTDTKWESKKVTAVGEPLTSVDAITDGMYVMLT